MENRVRLLREVIEDTEASAGTSCPSIFSRRSAAHSADAL